MATQEIFDIDIRDFDRAITRQIWSAEAPYATKVIALSIYYGDSLRTIRGRMPAQVFKEHIKRARALTAGA